MKKGKSEGKNKKKKINGGSSKGRMTGGHRGYTTTNDRRAAGNSTAEERQYRVELNSWMMKGSRTEQRVRTAYQRKGAESVVSDRKTRKPLLVTVGEMRGEYEVR